MIDRVEPIVVGGDAGSWPVKRVVDDPFVVRATLFKDGHDKLGASLLYRPAGEPEWRETPLRVANAGLDLYEATIALDRVGRWLYTVEAWLDRYATWRDGVRKKIDADGGIDVSLEVLEGRAIIQTALDRCEEGALAWHSPHTVEDAAARKDVERRIEHAAKLGPAEAARLLASDEVAAFVERWGDRPLFTRYSRELEVWVDRPAARFAAWYEMFPRSFGDAPGRHGTFETAAARLPAIAEMGFDVVYLPPIHPIGQRFRKGKNNALTAEKGDPGSPWAIGGAEGGHKAVSPALGTLADFDRFVQRAKEVGLEVALDFAIQCSPDHPYVREHPEWFFKRPDGTIQYAENPPKKYQDIYPLNFWGPHREALWEELRSIVLFWIDYGVRTFRVDNPHTKPLAFWRWLIETVHERHPDALFLAEAFTRPPVMRALAKAGFSQSYTYFTWRNDKAGLAEYLTELTSPDGEMSQYFRGNLWPNTPDILNEYLVEGGRPAFKARLVLAATLSSSYGIYSGYELCENVKASPTNEEYLDSEKYELKWRDWSAPDSLAPYITRINAVRRRHPALQLYDNLRFHEAENDAIIVYSKSTPDFTSSVIIVVNLDPREAQQSFVDLTPSMLGMSEGASFDVEDVITGARYAWKAGRNWVRLDPHDEPAHLFVVHRG